MFKINKDDLSLHLTRGDSAIIPVEVTKADGGAFAFSGETVVFRVSEAKDTGNAILHVEVTPEVDATKAQIALTETETRIGDPISKPVDYWYEVSVIGTDGSAQTIIGYDENGAKVLRLYPEIGDPKEVTT